MGSRSRLQRFVDYWFEPAAPTNLCVSRVVFYGGLLALYWSEDFRNWGSVSPAFWMPLPAFKALGLHPLSVDSINVIQWVWRVALALSAIGLLSRVSMAVACVLGFYLLGLPHNFGHVYHFDALIVIAMLTLTCSRAGDAWSVDARRLRRAQPPPSGEYTWPIRLIWLSMAFVFVAAGLSKLRHGGIAWVASPNMAIILTRAAYHVSDADPVTTAGLWIASHSWLSEMLALTALGVELGFVVALFSARARAVLVPAAAGMLVGIRVLMGPTFSGFLIVNVFWIPWDAVLSWVADRTGWTDRKRAEFESRPRLAVSHRSANATDRAPREYLLNRRRPAS
jgi:hypothetical protein